MPVSWWLLKAASVEGTQALFHIFIPQASAAAHCWRQDTALKQHIFFLVMIFLSYDTTHISFFQIYILKYNLFE